MAHFHTIILCISLIFFSSKDNRQTIDKNLTAFSHLQCKAAALNEKRFKLFDQIRSLEVDKVGNKVAIDSLENVAAFVKKESLECADTLRVKLTNLMTSQKFSVEDRKYFDDKINALVGQCKISEEVNNAIEFQIKQRTTNIKS